MENEQPPSMPDSTAIAAHALETLEAKQAPPPADSGASASGATGTPPPAAPAPPTTSAELRWLEEQGHGATKVDGRANWLPVSTVEKMLGRWLEKHKGDFEKERSTWQSERQALASGANQAQYFRRLVEQDPQALIARLAQLDARYQQFLQREAPQPVEDDPEPEPDLDLGNGRRTYSLDGSRKVREWDRRQMERAFNERLAPLLQRAQGEAQREARQRFEHTLRERTQATLQRAASWPKFKDFEDEITRVLQEDSRQAEMNGTEPQLSLHDAYMQVVMPQLSGDHNAIREAVMKELNGAPRSTAVAHTGAEPVRKPGPLTSEEIARRAYVKLEKQMGG